MEQSITSFNTTNHQEELNNFIITALERLVKEQKQQVPKEWLSLKEGAKYANVSYNTFIKFLELGLKVCEIDGVKRVSKTEIDSFLNKHSY